MTDSATRDVVRSRRAILAAAAGGAAALAATAIGPASVAAVAGPMLTETDNAESAPTGVSNSSGTQAFFGHSVGEGNGIEGASVTGHGTRGISGDTSDPESNESNAGVVGVAGDIGNIAGNIAITGVYGYADASAVQDFAGAGVWGDSPDFGVIGTGSIGVWGTAPFGVVGETDVSGGVGVSAVSDVADAMALRVIGRAEFSRSGRTAISAGKSSRTIPLVGCTPSTMIFAVLAANRSGRWVRAAVPGSGQFTVYLNTAVTSSTLITWIAFTNPGNHAG